MDPHRRGVLIVDVDILAGFFCPCLSVCASHAIRSIPLDCCLVCLLSADASGLDCSKGIKNFSLRGTKYSLPLPVQGRGKDDIVLREDQLAMSRHRQRKPKAVVDEDGFTTFIPRDERKNPTNYSSQDVVGMGYAGGGKRNPNARKRR